MALCHLLLTRPSNIRKFLAFLKHSVMSVCPSACINSYALRERVFIKLFVNIKLKLSVWRSCKPWSPKSGAQTMFRSFLTSALHENECPASKIYGPFDQFEKESDIICPSCNRIPVHSSFLRYKLFRFCHMLGSSHSLHGYEYEQKMSALKGNWWYAWVCVGESTFAEKSLERNSR